MLGPDGRVSLQSSDRGRTYETIAFIYQGVRLGLVLKARNSYDHQLRDTVNVSALETTPKLGRARTVMGERD